MTAGALALSAGGWISERQRKPMVWALALAVSMLALLAPAIWNGFPFIFYDTAAFLQQAIEGGFVAERSVFYAWFLVPFLPGLSLWPAMVAQAIMTLLVMAEFARVLAPSLSPARFASIILGLCIGTGLPWYAGQVLPDILAPLLVLSLYLLAFHGAELPWPRKAALFAVAVLATTSHASHLALAAGLAVVIAVMQFVLRRKLPQPGTLRWRSPAFVVVLSLFLMVTSNFVRTGEVFINRTGSAFLLGRLVQDGVVKRLLDETCPESGYRLCPYKDDLPKTADDWMWHYQSPFWKLGGFDGVAPEARRIIQGSLKRYPLMHVRMAVLSTLEQMASFATGDGIEPLSGIPVAVLERTAPQQITAYNEARQQDRIQFLWVNTLHVPIGIVSMGVLAAMLIAALRRHLWGDRAFLPIFLLTALIGNAFICGALSNPHDRYQSRMMWAASFAALILAAPRRSTDAAKAI